MVDSGNGHDGSFCVCAGCCVLEWVLMKEEGWDDWGTGEWGWIKYED